MRAETYTHEIRVRAANEKGIEVLLKIQAVFSEWEKSRRMVWTLSSIVAMCLFCWGLDTAACAYERLFPPPMPPNGHWMQFYRIIQHALFIVTFSLLTWCIHTLFRCFLLTPKKEAFQKELESLLTEYPGFLGAIKKLDLDFHNQIIGFLPAESEHFAR